MFSEQTFSTCAPGMGDCEHVYNENAAEYFADLAAIPDWRKRLCHSWVQPFELDNLMWASVQHYIEASKFKVGHPDFYSCFSINANSLLSWNVELAKLVGSKVALNHGYLRPEIDNDFFGLAGRQDFVEMDAMAAKFSQNDDLQRILLATKDAVLFTESTDGRREVEAAIFWMSLRKKLSNQKELKEEN